MTSGTEAVTGESASRDGAARTGRPHARVVSPDVRPWPDRRGLPLLVTFLVALGNVVAAPYTSNQNQYLAHLDSLDPRLAGDWLVGTTDPYPFFTLVADLTTAVGGTTALRVLAFLTTWLAVWAVYVLARSLAPGSRGVPLVATVLVGATLVVLPRGAFVVSGTALSLFSGLGDQYVVSKPAFVQPSVAGSLLLLAFALWVGRLHSEGANGRRRLPASVMVVLACMLHPTYMVVVLMALGAAFVADLTTGKGRTHLARYSLLAVVVVVGAVAANPGMLQLAGSAGSSEAIDRFAFERIPQHTLLTHWSLEDVWRVALVLVALRVLPTLRSGRWLARWSEVALASSLVLALVVELSRWSALALLFPWRVSVVLVPLAGTAVATAAALRVRRLAPRHWRRDVVLVAVALAAVGLAGTTSQAPPSQADPSVVAVREAAPEGVGLIPLDQMNVRLNAGVPVYVDWKSAPYVGDELLEWWRRVDRVRAYENDPERFCSEPWSRRIDWLLHDVADALPSCLEEWPVAGSADRWQVLVRPVAVATDATTVSPGTAGAAVDQ